MRTIDYFYSDPHFGHAGVIEYAGRPFSTVTEMNAELVRRYNVLVGSSETVLWLGDCFFGPFARAEELMAELRGRKLLVLGNHDRSAARMARLGFEPVVDGYMQLELAGRPARAGHYPYRGIVGAEDVDARHGRRYEERKPERRKGELLVHGHTHQRQRRLGNMIHVGVDSWAFAPASRAEVEELARAVSG